MSSMTFVGNATMILRLGSFSLLTDPNFLHRGQYAYLGHGLVSRRLVGPAIGPNQVPALDAVVLSHLHGDHFDRVARRQLDKEVPLVTTTHAAPRLQRYGFAAQGLHTWESWALRTAGEELEIQSMPGVHARGALRHVLPPVMGTMLTHRVPGQPDRHIYISGDTLTGGHLDEIHERFPQIDVGILHLGGTRVLFHTVTMDDVQGVDAMRRVPTARTMAIHHEDYRAFRSPVARFVTRARAASLEHRVTVPGRGETVEL